MILIVLRWFSFGYGQRFSVGLLAITALLLVVCAKTSIPPSIAEDIVDITTGLHHTCALTIGGRVKCWGNNQDGQLGDGTRINKRAPEDVVGLMSKVKQVSAGSRHTCSLTVAESVKCWGNNRDYQLGDGTNMDRVTPVDVVGLTSGMRAIAAGESHTCAVTITGNVTCWGDNHEGQLGNGTREGRNTPPVDVVGISGVSMITAGLRHTCALTTVGNVKCWGDNRDGQLGDGTAVRRTTPIDVIGLSSGVTAIAGGERHTCALIHGGVKCWGNNLDGQLGDGTIIERVTPVDIAELTNGVRAITAGASHNCAVITGGSVKCWGNNNEGQLGDATVVKKVTPVDAKLLMNTATAIAAGGQHTCALSPDNMVQNLYCWGSNEYGQLGYR
jgi:alpha-tubulin suppressor-like RCC1 family protein